MNKMNKNQGETNVIPRIVCIILACCMWLYVMSEQNPIIERDYIVALSQKNLTQGMVVFNAPEKVSVRVRGPRGTLANLNPEAINAYLDLNNLSVGAHTVLVNARFLRGDVVEVSPRTVNLFIDVKREKIMPVTAKVVGTPAQDVKVEKQTVYPTEVKVLGAASRLDLIDKIVAPVDVNNRSDDFADKVRPFAMGKDGMEIPDITISPAEIRVETLLEHELASKEVPIHVNMEGRMPAGIKLRSYKVVPARILVSGPKSQVEHLTVVETEPVDLGRLNKDKTMRADIHLPDEIKSATKTVELQIQVETAGTGQPD